MIIAPVADVKARFSSYLKRCARSPIVVTKNGRAVALLVSVPNEDDLERSLLAHTPKFRELLQEAEERIRRTGGVKHKDFWKSVNSMSRRK